MRNDEDSANKKLENNWLITNSLNNIDDAKKLTYFDITHAIAISDLKFEMSSQSTQ